MTLGINIGGQQRFLRSEIDAFNGKNRSSGNAKLLAQAEARRVRKNFMEHGQISNKKVRIGNGTVYMKVVRFCSVHGEIDLFTCSDWHAKHELCNRDENPAMVGLELPKATAKAA